MIDDLTFRDNTPADLPAIEALYPRAFPDEDLLPLLRRLLADGDNVISLLATRAEQLAGHIAFTVCTVDGAPDSVALLGPLAVAPEMQRQGIGSALIRRGLDRLGTLPVSQVNVLGDPAYYGRFGFQQDDQLNPPYDLPKAWRPAWQVMPLGVRTATVSGTLAVTAPWQDPALWGP